MIDVISGVVYRKDEGHLYVNAGFNVGYKVTVPRLDIDSVEVDHHVALNTYVAYKEDSQTLYGFMSQKDRDTFVLIITKVNGVGPSIAMKVFNTLSSDEFKVAVANGDSKLLSSCKGLGAKKADEIVRTLKDYYSDHKTADTTTVKAKVYDQDAISVLISLGYKLLDARAAVIKVQEGSTDDLSTEEIVRLSLKR
jgi:Holliday junction DNA helicase RuvA